MYPSAEKQLRDDAERSLRWLADQIGSGAAPTCLARTVIAAVSAPPAATAPAGEWSPPMNKLRMMRKLGLGPRSFATFGRAHGLRRINRQLFQICLDRMDAATRRTFEKS